jgi:hypothetical protein
VALWTYAVAFAFLAVILRGRLSVLTDQALEPQYLLLLGIPVVGAAGANLITSAKVKNQELDKPAVEDPEATTLGETPEQDPPGPLQALAEAVSDDQGRGDIGDFQYFMFNLVALAFFFVALFTSDTGELPKIPDTLVALTGASALAYLTKKGVVNDQPIINGVYPSRGSRGDVIRVRGHHFLGASSANGVSAQTAGTRRRRQAVADPSKGVQVMIGGVLAEDVKCLSATTIEAVVPDAPVELLQLTVVTAGGLEADPVDFDVVAPSVPTIDTVRPILLQPRETFKIAGSGFKHGSVPPTVDVGGERAEVLRHSSISIDVQLPDDVSGLTAGAAELVVSDGLGRASAPFEVELRNSPP